MLHPSPWSTCPRHSSRMMQPSLRRWMQNICQRRMPCSPPQTGCLCLSKRCPRDTIHMCLRSWLPYCSNTCRRYMVHSLSHQCYPRNQSTCRPHMHGSPSQHRCLALPSTYPQHTEGTLNTTSLQGHSNIYPHCTGYSRSQHRFRLPRNTCPLYIPHSSGLRWLPGRWNTCQRDMECNPTPHHCPPSTRACPHHIVGTYSHWPSQH